MYDSVVLTCLRPLKSAIDIASVREVLAVRLSSLRVYTLPPILSQYYRVGKKLANWLVCLHPRWRASDRLLQSLRYWGRAPSLPDHGFCNYQTRRYLRSHWVYEISQIKTFCALQVFVFELKVSHVSLNFFEI